MDFSQFTGKFQDYVENLISTFSLKQSFRIDTTNKCFYWIARIASLKIPSKFIFAI